MREFYLKMTKNISGLDVVILFFAFLLVLPFLVLTYYNNPSIDDYSFVYYVRQMGFWKTQYNWYTTWTGRYTSMFLLSLHPLWLKSLMLYKLISLGIIFFTVHSIYKFLSFLFNSLTTSITLAIAFIISFVFFNDMPSLVQGLYWEPGSVTYQLANILTLYFVINVIQFVLTPKKKLGLLKIYINYFLIVLICGLNETSMIVLVIIIALALVFCFIKQRAISLLLVNYQIIAVVFSLIVFLAPGNKIRAGKFKPENSEQFYFTIISSFKTGGNYIVQWIFSPQIIILIIGILFFLIITIKRPLLKKKFNLYPPLIILFGGYVLISVSLITGFWALGEVAPSRTINITYWLFICFLVAFLSSLTSLFNSFLLKLKKWQKKLSLGVLILSLLLSLDVDDNYYGAVKDLFNGKAALYNKEFLQRERTMIITKNEECYIPAFSVFPRSIFNEELSASKSNWWNNVYAYYYNKKEANLIFKESPGLVSYFFNFDDSDKKLLKNLNTLTKEYSYSLPNSSLLDGKETYSATFRIDMKNIAIDDIYDVNKIIISAKIYSNDSLANLSFVISVDEKSTNRNILWKGSEIKTSHNEKTHWVEREFQVSLEKTHLSFKNKITIYVWNRSDFKVYIDDLNIIFY